MALPSRISFFYPVANSIELSDDYWKRYNSKPFKLELTVGDKVSEIGYEPYTYAYTPFSVDFSKKYENYDIGISYAFCNDLPVFVFKITIKNTGKVKQGFALTVSENTSLHSCHTYTLFTKGDVSYYAGENDQIVGVTNYQNIVDLGRASVFVANAGESPTGNNLPQDNPENPEIKFTYKKELAPAETMDVIQLIGSCRSDELKNITRSSLNNWKSSVEANTARVMDFVNKYGLVNTPDPVLNQNSAWSKATIESLKHYIKIGPDGRYIPMPCPAEYNFYFTHDVLVTGFGVVYFDPSFVKNGYDFLLSLVNKNENLAPHAYYWKDNQYETEYINATSWNNLWVAISVASYLKHSNDIATAKKMFPVLKVSLDQILATMRDDYLMPAHDLDWWDIGDAYGARTFLSSLAYRAIQSYAYIAIRLGKTDDLVKYLQTADKIKAALNEKLWDDKKGFLFNELSKGKIDYHYYSGSLIAPFYGVIDQERSAKLLNTAEKELLDKDLGIRNAMPMDFDELIPLYGFTSNEQGAKGYYMNGAIWPQGNAWYALSLISNGQLNKAENVVKKYMTVNGIMNSPNGTPSFYETRITANNSEYGQIDKPTFLWSGGWYYYLLYQLSGVRENAWNIYFSPELPSDFGNIDYYVALMGDTCHVKYQGENGNLFSQILIDDKKSNSSIITAPAKEIILTRGIPAEPYLASASCIITDVNYSSESKTLAVHILGIKGESFDLSIVSPLDIKDFKAGGKEGKISSVKSGETNIISYTGELDQFDTILYIEFK